MKLNVPNYPEPVRVKPYHTPKRVQAKRSELHTIQFSVLSKVGQRNRPALGACRCRHRRLFKRLITMLLVRRTVARGGEVVGRGSAPALGLQWSQDG